jgi:5-methylcytosine-specific restriction enzyme A
MTEVPVGRISFCGQPCIDLWTVRTGSGTEKFLRKRDRGICALCSMDCVQLLKQMRRLRGPELQAFQELYQIPKHRTRRLWDIDHIVPVVEGGGSCGPENLRTLCTRCHRKVTTELAGKRALARRAGVEPVHDGSDQQANGTVPDHPEAT